MLTLAPGTDRNIVVHSYDSEGLEDPHDFTFQSSDNSKLGVTKWAPNKATLSPHNQGDFTLTVTATDVGFTHVEAIRVDDTGIASISVEFA